MFSNHSEDFCDAYEILLPPADTEAEYKLEDALALTYSLDLMVAAATLLALGGHPIGQATRVRSQEQMTPAKFFAAMTHLCEHVCFVTQNLTAREFGVVSGARIREVIGLLDQQLVVVKKPDQHYSFHPKLWLLQFGSRKPDCPKRFRVIISSRNLTNARCMFENCLVLEGASEQSSRFSEKISMHGLEDLIEWMKKSNSPHLRRLVPMVQACRKGFYEIPSHAESVEVVFQMGKLAPLSTSKKKAGPISIIDRMGQIAFRDLVMVSPFLDEGRFDASLVSKLTARTKGGRGRKPLLISSEQGFKQLEKGNSTDSQWKRVLESLECVVVQNQEFKEPSSGQGQNGDGVERVAKEKPSDPPTGLHAKMIVGKNNAGTHIWLGSGNLSNAGWSGRNTECMAHLVMRGNGFATFLRDFVYAEPVVKRMLHPWLRPYKRSPLSNPTTEDEIAKERETLENWLVSLQWRITAIRTTDNLGMNVEFLSCGDILKLRHYTFSEMSVKIRSFSGGNEVCCSVGSALPNQVFLKLDGIGQMSRLLVVTLYLHRQTEGAEADSIEVMVLADDDGLLENLPRSKAIAERFVKEDQGFAFLDSLLDGGATVTQRGKGSGKGSAPSNTCAASLGLYERLIKRCGMGHTQAEQLESNYFSHLDPEHKDPEVKELASLWKQISKAMEVLYG